METYLVEHYRPGSDAAALLSAAESIRAATAGRGVRYRRSTIVPGDEAFLSVFEAVSEDALREAYARGGMSFDRITLALQEEPS